MTEPFSSQSDDTRTEGAQPSHPDEAGVRGGDAADLEHAAALGETDDSTGGSLQQHGSRP